MAISPTGSIGVNLDGPKCLKRLVFHAYVMMWEGTRIGAKCECSIYEKILLVILIYFCAIILSVQASAGQKITPAGKGSYVQQCDDHRPNDHRIMLIRENRYFCHPGIVRLPDGQQVKNMM
jgi:hypothetical protein